MRSPGSAERVSRFRGVLTGRRCQTSHRLASCRAGRKIGGKKKSNEDVMRVK